MAGSLLDLLLNRASGTDRLSALLPLIMQQKAEEASAAASYYQSPEADTTGTVVPGVDPGSVVHVPGSTETTTLPTSPGAAQLGAREGLTLPKVRQTRAVDAPPGETQYAYTVYDKPFTGTPDLVTRFGISLQPGPMASLLDIARESDIMRGAREISMIGGGYRPASAQVGLDASNGALPAADPGYSFHQQGLAIDADWWRQREALRRALIEAGWNWGIGFDDPVHFSYGVYG